MKLGISSYTYGWAVGVAGYMPEHPLTFLDLIERTHEFGLSLLQVGDNLPLDRLTGEELQQGKALLEKYGIQLELGIRGLTDRRLEQYISLCRFFSAKLLRVVIDEEDFQPSEEEIIAILKQWEPTLARWEIVLGIENHDRLKVMQLVRILRHVNSPFVGICLDCANSLGALEGMETISDALIPYTVNLHAKDISICRLPSQMGFQITGTASCEGMLDLRSLLDRVVRNGKNATCILEQWTAYTGDLEQTLQKEAEEAARGVHNLRKLVDNVNQSAKKQAICSTVFKTDAVLVREVHKQDSICHQVCFYRGTLPHGWTKEMGTQLEEQCRQLGIRIDQVCAESVSELIADGCLLSPEGREMAQAFLQAAINIPGCKEVVVPLGKCELAGRDKMTISQMKQIEERYFWELAEFVRMCQYHGFEVGIQLLPDSFVDNESILLQEMIHNNVSGFHIYRLEW